MIRILTFLTVISMPLAAGALPTYPGDITDELQLSYNLNLDHCTLCHTDNNGGAGTVVRSFGVNMVARGLDINEIGSIATALAAMESDAVDSDSDGVGDIDELRNGTDPNGTGAFTGPSPIYGCGGAEIEGTHIAGVRPPASFWTWALVALAGVAMWLRRRR